MLIEEKLHQFQCKSCNRKKLINATELKNVSRGKVPTARSVADASRKSKNYIQKNSDSAGKQRVAYKTYLATL